MAELTDIQVRALRLIRDNPPMLSASVAEALWPDRRFKSRQGAGQAGGGLMGKLDKAGMVRMRYSEHADRKGRCWPLGWVLTVDGRIALGKAERSGR